MKRSTVSTLLGIVLLVPGLACVSGGVSQSPAHTGYGYGTPGYGGYGSPSKTPASVAAAPAPWAAGTTPLNGCDPGWPQVRQADGSVVCQPPGPASRAATHTGDSIAPIDITASPPDAPSTPAPAP